MKMKQRQFCSFPFNSCTISLSHLRERFITNLRVILQQKQKLLSYLFVFFKTQNQVEKIKTKDDNETAKTKMLLEEVESQTV